MSEPGKAVFLSYASQDAEAARRIADALRAAGVEVWFDQSELRGGDAWDAAIRKQIKECALFVPVISANTQSRAEGYFRLEWKLADRRTDLIGKSKAFLLPVCIDDTRDSDADVPDSFTAVQWTRLRPAMRDYAGQARTGDEEPELVKFVARVKKLLGLEVAQASSLLPKSDAGWKPALPPGRSTRRPWLMPVAIGAVAVAAALFMWRPWQGGPATAAPAAHSTPLSPARELVAKARDLFEEGDDSNRENFLLAEDLLLQAEKLDPFDGEVWAARAQLSGALLNLGYDHGEQRRADLRRQAERAIKLAPDSLESQLANAHYLASQPGTLPEAEQILTALIKRAPEDWRPLRIMAHVVLRQERPEEGYAWADRAASFPDGAAVALVEKATWLFIDGRFDEAEKAVDRSLAIRPLGRALLLKIRAQVLWQGDLDGARATVERVPPSLLLEDRGAFNAYRVWLWRREPDKAISVLRGVSRDFLEDGQFIGPKAVLMASAQRLAGRHDLAKSEWNLALRLIDERLGASPNQSRLLYLRTLCLVELGRIPDAEEALRAFRQTDNEGYQMWPGGGMAGLLLKLGRPSEAMDHLAKEQQSGIRLFNSRAVLGLNPDFDPLRGDPRFQEILARAPGPAQAAASAPVSDSKSIAVLAFANLSDDKANEYFSDGISEELLNVLAKVPGLKVSARTSAFHFKGKDTPIPDIARQLGVAYVVEGSVRQSGDRVRITAQLIKAADGFHVWSDTFTRDLKDIFAVQDEIAGLIAQNLSLKLGATAQATRTVNPEAYRLVLEGRHFWNQRSEEGFARAEAAFQQALQVDATFAEAHGGLADVHLIRAAFRIYEGRDEPYHDDLGRSRAEAQRALALDAELGSVFPTLGLLAQLEGRWDEASAHFDRAAALNPNYATLHHWRALLFESTGRLDAALAELEQAAQLDPLSFIIFNTLTRHLLWAQRHAEALATNDRVLALRPDFIPALGTRSVILLALGRREDAIGAARAVLAAPTTALRWNADVDAVHVLRETGHEGEATELIATLLPRWLEDSFLRACISLVASRGDDGWAEVERTPSPMKHFLYWSPVWDSLRDTPRFQQAVTKLGVAQEYRVARETLGRMLDERQSKP